MNKLNQTDRLIRYLREHEGASSLDITLAIGCVNVTGRISDARKEGHVVECFRDKHGTSRYRLRATEQLAIGLSA